ncbi:MAG: response regulator [bacterium]|nr:response regulator [bacterium]
MMQKKPLLLIEDEEELSQLYRNALEKSGYIVFTSKDGLQGIDKAIGKDVELILLDLMMPMADGRDVLAMIRLNKKGKEIPVIIISNLNPGTIDLSEVDDQIIDYWIKAELTPLKLVSRLNQYFGL